MSFLSFSVSPISLCVVPSSVYSVATLSRFFFLLLSLILYFSVLGVYPALAGGMVKGFLCFSQKNI